MPLFIVFCSEFACQSGAWTAFALPVGAQSPAAAASAAVSAATAAADVTGAAAGAAAAGAGASASASVLLHDSEARVRAYQFYNFMYQVSVLTSQLQPHSRGGGFFAFLPLVSSSTPTSTSSPRSHASSWRTFLLLGCQGSPKPSDF